MQLFQLLNAFVPRLWALKESKSTEQKGNTTASDKITSSDNEIDTYLGGCILKWGQCIWQARKQYDA